VASLWEKLLNLWRDIKWVVSASSRPDEEELNLVAKFLALVAFIAGAFQIVFHVAGVFINRFVYKTPLYTLGDPIKETVAVLVSITLIFVGLLYLMIKLR
jgi:preprotein translocase subunit Sss1